MSKIDKDGKRHYLIRAIPYQDRPQGLSARQSGRWTRWQEYGVTSSTNRIDPALWPNRLEVAAIGFRARVCMRESQILEKFLGLRSGRAPSDQADCAA